MLTEILAAELGELFLFGGGVVFFPRTYTRVPIRQFSPSKRMKQKTETPPTTIITVVIRSYPSFFPARKRKKIVQLANFVRTTFIYVTPTDRTAVFTREISLWEKKPFGKRV